VTKISYEAVPYEPETIRLRAIFKSSDRPVLPTEVGTTNSLSFKDVPASELLFHEIKCTVLHRSGWPLTLLAGDVFTWEAIATLIRKPGGWDIKLIDPADPKVARVFRIYHRLDFEKLFVGWETFRRIRET
jgi:hypothetical protein